MKSYIQSPLEDWQELKNYLMEAKKALTQMGELHDNEIEKDRLLAKADGVTLALFFIEKIERHKRDLKKIFLRRELR